MRMTEILAHLPGDTEWAVVFELDSLRALVADGLCKELMFLAPDAELEAWSHVGLTSCGRFLAPRDGELLVDGENGDPWAPMVGRSLADVHAAWCAAFPPDEAQCFALGVAPGLDPVLLHVRIDGGDAHARALFTAVPPTSHYELLAAVGVRHEGTDAHPLGAVGRFHNRLPDHLRAGILSHFRRTEGCNRFFLLHGRIDEELERGLLCASEHRIGWKAGTLANRLELLAVRGMAESLAMRWDPPVGDASFAFGDVVPLAFVRAGLWSHGDSGLTAPLGQWLDRQRLRGLWPFQAGDLETSTDSALVLTGVRDPEAVRALDRFLAPDGGYLPQLTSAGADAGTMRADAAKLHWCQADYATTAAVRGHQRRCGMALGRRTGAFLADGFEERSGLYFANPFFVDWLAATSLDDGDERRVRLADEILGAMSPSGAFGNFDPVLSTACAILALGELGCRGRALRAAQLALTRMLQNDGLPPVEVPFYSSLLVHEPAVSSQRLASDADDSSTHAPSFRPDALEVEGRRFDLRPELAPRVVEVLGHRLAVSFHVDQHRMVVGGLALRALCVPRDEVECDRLSWRERRAEPHPRYTCTSRLEYIGGFALPPYVRSLVVGAVS